MLVIVLFLISCDSDSYNSGFSSFGVFLFVIGFILVIAVVVALFYSNDDNNPIRQTNYNTSSSESYKKYANNQQIDDNSSLTVVGGFYRDRESRDYIESLQLYDEVFFLAEPDNEHDRNAVMVISSSGLHLGYVPRTMAGAFKYRLSNERLKGLVISLPNNYQFAIKVLPVDNLNIYNQAIANYLHNKETKIKASIDIQKFQFYSDLMVQSVNYYKSKQYSQVFEVLKPMIENDVKEYSFYKLLIFTYHCLGDYNSESIYLDKILSLERLDDKDFFNRRKYHVLRILGYIVNNEQIENVKVGVETTVLELDFFHRIVTLLSDVVDPNRIDFRDSKNLFAINLDGNIRKPICKLYLNNPARMFIGLMNGDGNILKIPIKNIEELDDIKDDLLMPIQQFLNTEN